MCTTKQELIEKTFLNKTEIAKLFNVPLYVARKIFDNADKLDDEKFGNYRIYDSKVRLTSCCKVTGVSINQLKKQIGE